jgi:NAD(P)-dependent dehydrogenase (short-subunit alcohol dehydrogenase family)
MSGSEISNPLTGKVALVTGGSQGIGKAIAGAYARAGAKVVICGRQSDALDRALADLHATGNRVDSVPGDVGRAEEAKRIVQRTLDRYGTIDVLVNNASLLGPRVTIAVYPVAAWEDVIRVNLTGPFLMTQEVLQTMLPRDAGSIINVSSGVGRVGRARWGAYAVSKFGLEGFTQILAEELKETRIRANAVNPGPTRTAMRAHAYPDEDPETLPTPDKIAPVFLYLASDESTGVSGKSFDAQTWLKR